MRSRPATERSASRSRSGMPSLYGPGTSSSIIAPSAETTSWTSASNAKQTKHQLLAKSALSPGVSAIMLSTSTAFRVGLRPGRFALWTTATGSSRSTVVETMWVPKRISRMRGLGTARRGYVSTQCAE